jgi:hypothetical protein
MKIGVTGCSHSSPGYGNPWHHYMGQKLNATIIKSSSSGQGNEMNIEKIRYIFENNKDLDFFVVQLTEPSRFVLPIGKCTEKEQHVLQSFNCFNGIKFFSLKHSGNDKQIKESTNADIRFDSFFRDFVYVSDFNTKYKLMHTMMSIQYLADFYQKKLIFFSWFVDVKEIAISINYEHIINKMIILDGYVEKFAKENKLPYIPRNSHYASNEHEIIYNDFIHPQLEKIIKINNTKI